MQAAPSHIGGGAWHTPFKHVPPAGQSASEQHWAPQTQLAPLFT